MGWFATIAADPFGLVALVLLLALIVDMITITRLPKPPALPRPTPAPRKTASMDRKTRKSTADAVRRLDLRAVAQGVEDMIIDREHLVRILGTRALDLWIDLSIEEGPDGPALKTRAKIAAFEPIALTEDRIAQCARMIKRRVVEQLTDVLGFDAEDLVAGVTIETAIERRA